MVRLPFVALLVALLVAGGCASTGPELTVAAGGAPEPLDPRSLIGWWRVEGTDQVVLIDPSGLEVVDSDPAIGGGPLTVIGTWRADPAGRMLVQAETAYGPAIDVLPGGDVDAVADLGPDWLPRVVGYRTDGAIRVLLDRTGTPVAVLIATEPTQGSGAVDPARPVDDGERRRFEPAVAVPAPWRPAQVQPGDPTEPVGRWVPEGASGSAWLELTADEGWSGSDGCNGTGGRWVTGAGGAFLAAAATVSTLIACDGGTTDVAGMVGAARRAAFDGPALLLLDVDGEVLGRFVRG